MLQNHLNFLYLEQEGSVHEDLPGKHQGVSAPPCNAFIIDLIHTFSHLHRDGHQHTILGFPGEHHGHK